MHQVIVVVETNKSNDLQFKSGMQYQLRITFIRLIDSDSV